MLGGFGVVFMLGGDVMIRVGPLSENFADPFCTAIVALCLQMVLSRHNRGSAVVCVCVCIGSQLSSLDYPNLQLGLSQLIPTYPNFPNFPNMTIFGAGATPKH